MNAPRPDQSGTESNSPHQLREAPLAGRILAFGRTHWLPVLFVGAFVVRIAFILVSGPMRPPSLRADDSAYDGIAFQLVTQHVYNNTWYPPGYPLFLAVIYALFGHSWLLVRVIQAGIGAGTCVLTYHLGAKVFSKRAGSVAAVLLAIYPGHVFFSWRLSAETLYILLLVLSSLLALSLAEDPRPLRAMMLGVVVGGTQLVKANLFLFPALLLVWFAFAARCSVKRRIRCLAVLVVSLALMALIQPMANLMSPGGRATALPGNAGSALWQGNNPLADGFFNWPDTSVEGKAFIESHGFTERLEKADPFETDRIRRTLALLWIRENPRQFVVLLPKKLNNAFGLFPRAQVFEGNPLARIVHLLSYGLIAPFALGGMIAALRRWRACSLLYIVFFSYVPTVLVFWGTPRYTILIIPFLLVFAGNAMLACFDSVVGPDLLPRLGNRSGDASKAAPPGS